MIPAFDPTTGALPAGIHESDWAEFSGRFGHNAHRQALLAGMKKALAWVINAGGTRVYIGGSFVTAKELPGDWDGCVDSKALDMDQLSDSILNEDRPLMRGAYAGELFLNTENDDFLSYFQNTRHGRAVGIVALTITEEDLR